MQIHNCHIHIFTVDHVPDDLLPFKLTNLFRHKWVRTPVLFILRKYDPGNNRDKAERYANLIRMSYKKSQKEIFDEVRKFYPGNTIFVILPMDMEYMEAGKIKDDYKLHKQHMELAELRNHDDYKDIKDNIISFMAIDPRRQQHQDLRTMAEDLHKNYGFKGIKIYPPLGFFPTDARLDPVYQYAIENNLPMMTHCSRGGVHYQGSITDDMTHPDTGEELKKQSNDIFTGYYTDPDNYGSLGLRVVNRCPSQK